VAEPTVVLLTPGAYNSAYFEHTYLARQMGIEIVEGRDLVVRDQRVFMRTTKGLQPVHVIYRRIDDDFLDPTVFRRDSASACPASSTPTAPATSRSPTPSAPAWPTTRSCIISSRASSNTTSTRSRSCRTCPPTSPARRSRPQYMLENLDKLVVKAANEAGGYGMLMGPHATPPSARNSAAASRPTAQLHRPAHDLALAPPDLARARAFAGRHIDLRPFILYGEKTVVIPGGLTRVALRKGSLVVNSSQGGGSKDTWVLYGNE
jgi:uncharacterized circularly permuted ATP-grasp superfamily protein